MTQRLVIVGADAAGMSAASQARRRRPPDDLEIVAFERGSTPSYSACGIPYWLGGTVKEREALIVRTPTEFAERQSIEVRVDHEVVDLDVHRGEVTVRDLESGTDRKEPFDELLIATGATPIRPDLPGADAQGIFGVQTLDDGSAILRALEERDAKNVVVVGGGYIGLEMAEALVLRGLHVTMVERAPQPLNKLDPDMGAVVADAMRDVGIELHLDDEVRAFQVGGRRVTGVETEDGVIPADLVVLGIGVRPASELAAAAGIPVGATGGVITDQRMHTSVDNVWAAGDCIETYHRVSRSPVAFALGTHANKQGRVAGINLGGGYATFPGVVGTAASKVCSLEVARTGLNESEAERAGFAYVTATVDSKTRAGYFPGSAKLRVKVLAEQRSGRLLGAQIVGGEGAAKRIDVFATALWNDMTVEQLLNVDLSYAPPFAPVWDPVLIAARKAWEAVEERAPEAR